MHVTMDRFRVTHSLVTHTLTLSHARLAHTHTQVDKNLAAPATTESPAITASPATTTAPTTTTVGEDTPEEVEITKWYNNKYIQAAVINCVLGMFHIHTYT